MRNNGAIIWRLMLAGLALTILPVAEAAELNGISMPETRTEDGTKMWLNGIGLRTFSIFRISIYVAGLYLERRSDNADTIMNSSDWKLIDFRFLHDVGADHARKAWQEDLENNCGPPCYLDPQDVRRFLAAVPSVRKGDESTLLFTPRGVMLTFNGRPFGNIPDPHFAAAMLATFIGPKPPTLRLKRELLGVREESSFSTRIIMWKPVSPNCDAGLRITV